jgi:hypothetical protein
MLLVSYAGWAAISIDLCYHGERSGRMSGEYEQGGTWADEVMLTKHALRECL